MTVVPIRTGVAVSGTVAEPNGDVIEDLEAMLADAKSGKLRAIAFATIDHDRTLSHGWVGHCDYRDLIAAVNTLAYRYMHDAAHDRDDA